MNKEQFINQINLIPEGGQINMDGLQEIVNSYPYCQSGQLLYYFSMLQNSDMQQQNRLKLVAAYAGDRGMLKDLSRVVHHFSSQINESLESDMEIRKAVADEPEEKSEQPVESPEDEKPEQSLNEENGAVSADMENMPEHQETTVSEADVKMGSATFAERDTELKDKFLNEDSVDKTDLPGKAEKDELKPVHDNETEPDEKPLNDPEKPELVEGRAEEIKSDKSAFKKSKSDLIDQFIKNAPRITRRQADFFNPVDYAKRSEIDKEDIVSETLAKIYYNQGSFEKAIGIYKKLILKVPEKSSYFARQIEKIKGKQNLNN